MHVFYAKGQYITAAVAYVTCLKQDKKLGVCAVENKTEFDGNDYLVVGKVDPNARGHFEIQPKLNF